MACPFLQAEQAELMNKLLHLSFYLLPALLLAEHPHGGIQKEILAQSEQSWDGATLPAYPDTPPQISVVKFTIPPKSSLPWHKHPSINAGCLIKGEITVVSEDGQEKKLKEGEALIELVDTWHTGRNDGDIPAEIIVVYAGSQDVPLAIIKEE